MIRPRFPWAASSLLTIAYGAAAFAHFFAPYDFEMQNRTLAFAPPTRIHFVDRNGYFHLRPFVYSSTLSSGDRAWYTEDLKSRYPIGFFVHGSDDFGPGENRHLFGTLAPARIFLLGSDGFGRDVFSRLLHGGRVSLVGSFGAAIVSVSLGLILGVVAGFYGSWVDSAVMRTTDVFMAMPWLYLLLAVRATLPLHMDSRHAYALLVIVLGAVGWARPARLIRGLTLSAKQTEFVLASRSFGASNFHLICEHILPSLSGVILAQLSLYIPQYILVEIIVSFFGLGVTEPVPSWGNMLMDLHVFVENPYWWLFAPVVAVFAILLAYHRLFSYIKKRTL